VGPGNAIHFAIKYDVKEVISFLMIIFQQLNPIVQAQIVAIIDGFAVENEMNNLTRSILGHPWINLHGY
jgi:hypothetical protein